MPSPVANASDRPYPASPSANQAIRLRCAVLAGWLIMPTIASAWVAGGGVGQAFASIMFSAWLLAWPLVLLGRVRLSAWFWAPVAFFAPLQLYLIYFFRSVPGDAVTSSALHLSWAQALELLSGFGWLPLLLPVSWIAYVLLVRSLPPALSMPAKQRKALAALLLLYAMLGMHGHRTLKHYISMPSLFNEVVAAGTYPAGALLSLARVLDLNSQPPVQMDRLGASATVSDQIVILVIGESARPDHFSINGYSRATTPRLQELGSELLSFSDVASSANFTYAAVPNLVSGQIGTRTVSLVSAFREAGFRTVWLSNQWSNLYTPGADISEFADNDQTYRQDTDLLPRLQSCLSQCGRRQLIVLHSYGSHFPYDERYRSADTVFKPIFRDASQATAAPAFRTELVNSYDNSLRETDRFVAGVIELAGATGRPALVLYTSDHGENLYDDERQMFLHLGQATRADSKVPMLVWASPAYVAQQPAKMAALRHARSLPIGHRAVLPTLLDLGGVVYPGQEPERSIASGRFKPVPRIIEMGSGARVDFELLR